MNFEEQYSLLDLVEDADAKTYAAVEIPTGRRVTVFLFVGEQAHSQRDMLLYLRSVDRSQFPELIDIGDDRGTSFVVTQPIGGLSEFKARLSRLRAAPPSPAGPESAELSEPDLRRIPGTHEPRSSGAGKASSEPQAGQPPAATPEKGEAGSFTQMFQSVSQPIGEPAFNTPQNPSPAPAAVPHSEAAPGEFTRFFNAAFETKPAGEPQKHDSQKEYANIFGGDYSEAGSSKSATGIFHESSFDTERGQSEVPPDQTPPAPVPQAGEFTRIFDKSAAEENQAPFPVEQVPAQSMPAKNAPGDYTRVFSAQQVSPESSADSENMPADTPEASVPAKSSSLLIPILVGIILFLLALLAVVVFATLK
jgi:hypothetical protein